MSRISRALVTLLLAVLICGCTENSAQPAEVDVNASIDREAAERGARIAQDCKACHSLTSKDNQVGPHLLGILGRKAASVPGYEYSEALAASNIVWDEENMRNFILNPIEVISGTKMAFGGITESEASDVIEYIKSVNSSAHGASDEAQ